MVMQGMCVMWNQGNDAGNHGENLSLAIEMTQDTNENDREIIKLRENEHICKNLVLLIQCGVFLVNFGHISYIVFLF